MADRRGAGEGGGVDLKKEREEVETARGAEELSRYWKVQLHGLEN